MKDVDLVIVKKKLIDLRVKLTLYASENIYNMKESIFYRKMIFDKTLITQQMFERKNQKTKIFINLATTAINQHRLNS